MPWRGHFPHAKSLLRQAVAVLAREPAVEGLRRRRTFKAGVIDGVQARKADYMSAGV